MHQGWRSRAPKELLAPHDYVVSVLRALQATENAVKVFAGLLREVAGLPPVISTLQELAQCHSEGLAFAVDRGLAARLTDELSRSRVNLAERLVSLRDLCMSCGLPTDPLVKVEEVYGAVQTRPVEVHGTWAVSWHRAVLSFGYDQLFTILDELGFSEAHPDADEYSERCATFDQREMQSFLAAFTQLGDGRDDESHQWREYETLENELRMELFHAWALMRSVPHMMGSKDSVPIVIAESDSDTLEASSSAVDDEADAIASGDGSLDTCLASGTDMADQVEGAARLAQAFRETIQLPPKQQEILELLRSTGKRMTTDMILQKLEASRGPTSVGTTKDALSQLRRMGFLTNRQDVTPKGYGLAEWE